MHDTKMIVIKGDIQDDVSMYRYNSETHRIDVAFSSGKIYSYGYDSVRILENPVELNLQNYNRSKGSNTLA